MAGGPALPPELVFESVGGPKPWREVIRLRSDAVKKKSVQAQVPPVAVGLMSALLSLPIASLAVSCNAQL